MKLIILEPTQENWLNPEEERGALTVGELKELLEDYDDETVVFMREGSYLYGVSEISEEY